MSILRCHWRVAAGVVAAPSAKGIQGNPRLSKEKSLDLFGFLWPIRVFSMGYSESKQKISFPWHESGSPPQIPVR
jgi:hypothetical protein